MHYILRRTGGALLVLVLAFTAAYILLAALPGDAVLARYGNPDLGLTAEQLAEIRAAYGADRPVVLQYLETAGSFLQGDLGYSVQSGAAVGADRPVVLQYLETAGSFLQGDLGYSVQSGAAVSALLAEALPSTLTLAGLALVVAVVLAVAIAFTATHGSLRGTRLTHWLRGTLRGLPPLMVSLPVFWIGIVLIQVFSFQLGLVPVLNASPVQSLILPVSTLAIPIAAPLAQVLIRSIDEVSAQPFVAVSRARGAST